MLNKNDIETLVQGVIKAHERSISKALSLVENKKEKSRDRTLTLLSMLPENDKSLRIAISGPPGVGKSSLIEIFGLELINKGFKVAVLAVDPSSNVSQGSISTLR